MLHNVVWHVTPVKSALCTPLRKSKCMSTHRDTSLTFACSSSFCYSSHRRFMSEKFHLLPKLANEEAKEGAKSDEKSQP